MDVNSTAGTPGFDGAPSHYKSEAGIQSFDVIDAYGMDFYRGNAFKYLARWNKKGSPANDLAKAEHYLIEALERTPAIVEDPANSGGLTPSVVVNAFRSEPGVDYAMSDLLMSCIVTNPRGYLRSAIEEVRLFSSTMGG